MSSSTFKILSKPIKGIVQQTNHQSKTIKVLTTSHIVHSVVPKAITRKKIYTVHDEHRISKKGDLIEIKPIGRRLSPNKTFQIDRILT
ncbi:30S ribosomal protein S17 [Melampsora americana]|nr:30S ribosomal protein S17 [Melampsora americana]